MAASAVWAQSLRTAVRKSGFAEHAVEFGEGVGVAGGRTNEHLRLKAAGIGGVTRSASAQIPIRDDASWLQAALTRFKRPTQLFQSK